MVECKPLRPTADSGGLVSGPSFSVFTDRECSPSEEVCGVDSSEHLLAAFDLASGCLAWFARSVWSFGGRTRRVPVPLGLLVRLSGPSCPLNASIAFCAICSRSIPTAAFSISTSSFISSSKSLFSDCVAEFNGSSPALVAISGLFRPPKKPMSTASPCEGCVRRFRPFCFDLPVGSEEEGDLGGGVRYSGDGESCNLTSRATNGGVRAAKASSES